MLYSQTENIYTQPHAQPHTQFIHIFKQRNINNINILSRARAGGGFLIIIHIFNHLPIIHFIEEMGFLLQ